MGHPARHSCLATKATLLTFHCSDKHKVVSNTGALWLSSKLAQSWYVWQVRPLAAPKWRLRKRDMLDS